MMKNTLVVIFFFFALFFHPAFAQTPGELHETAKSFMRQGDYANAIQVLNMSLEQDPKNTAMAKDLAMSYFYQRDNLKAVEIIKTLADRDDADDQVFQIAGMIYRQAGNGKESEKIYKKGLKKFPDSGPLYNELGVLQAADKNRDAIETWEKGIKRDPSYGRNYYNAARYYFFTTDKIWSIIYGEMFINMEPTGSKTPEIKQLIIDSYKKLFADPDLEKTAADKNRFEKTYLQALNRQKAVVREGINTETLSMLRTRFIVEWFAMPKPPPFRLFEYQRQLLKEGMFEAYNQWLFGASENLAAYENWINIHSAENNAFSELQKARIFKVPSGQYYK